MASKLMIVVAFALVVAIVSPVVLAIVVGDDKGWTINFDYQEWAKDKEFRVGDRLVFNYPKGVHNVFKVDGTDFMNCAAPSDNQGLTTGNDVITLSTPGKKWYICGVGKHCENGGQKLAINVLDEYEKSSAIGITPFGYQTLIVAAIAISMLVMV